MGGDGANYAFIENMATRGNQQLYQVGDAIQNRVIVDIRNDCIILEQNGKKEQLCFPNREGSAGPAPNQQSVSREASDADNDNDDSNEDVVQVDDATWRIRRELMQEQFANLGGLAQQARVTPYVVQGETRGFRVTRLKANSLLQKIGLQHGDVLQKVNGNSITSPADALQAYQQLQQAGTVRLEILRRDRASTLTYEIR
jgi:general secretion pathway protein C